MEWFLEELDRRYFLLASAGCLNIGEYNSSVDEKLPYLVCVIADYSVFDGPLRFGVLSSFCAKLCAKARAVGIHLILSSVEVPESLATSSFLNNFLARVVFRTDDTDQSRILIEGDDARYLYYLGYTCFKRSFDDIPVRLQAYGR